MPIRLWSETGNLVWQANADAWGHCEPETPDGSIHQPLRLPGQFEDELTGLHHNRFRDYDPETGRYLTPDPIGIKGGLNSYRYTPNPLDYIDPLGLDYESIIGAGNADKTELAALSNMKPDVPSMVETNGADVGSIQAMEPNWFRDTITGGVVNAIIGGPATDIADAWRNTVGNEKYSGINPLTNQNEGLRTGPERFMDWAPIPAANTGKAAKGVDNLADAARTATRTEVPNSSVADEVAALQRIKNNAASSTELNQQINLRGATANEYDRLLTEGVSFNKMGPALAGVMDTKTGQIFFGRNTGAGEIPSVLSPEMRASLEQMPDDVLTGYIKTKGAGTHAEVHALNDAMLARPGSTKSEFLLQVINSGGSKSTRGNPIPRCPHCSYLTDGVKFPLEPSAKGSN